MKNIVLGHCYTTENKGDAGIVLAAIERIQSNSPGIRIQGMSTFASKDDAFKHHHDDYRKAGAEMIPALLPEDKIFLGSKVISSAPAKAISFVKNLFSLVIGYCLYRLSPALAFGDVGRALSALDRCEAFISKGGSFIYNEGGFRGDLSLFKILLPFAVAKSFGKPTVVLAQSLGPFNTALSKRMFRHFLRYMDRLYLREDRCLKYLDYIDPELYRSKLRSCPDLAFALTSEGYSPMFETADGDVHIGMTIVNYRFASEERRRNYLDVFARTVEFFSRKYPGAKFHIFPQVLSAQPDGSVDVELSRTVKTMAAERLGVEIELIDGDYDPRVLRETYRRMDFFVATRLHSSIFAVAVGVPTIVFGYHGTKAEGVWAGLGFDRFFFNIDTMMWNDVEAALEEITSNREEISEALSEKTAVWKSRINDVVRNELAGRA